MVHAQSVERPRFIFAHGEQQPKVFGCERGVERQRAVRRERPARHATAQSARAELLVQRSQRTVRVQRQTDDFALQKPDWPPEGQGEIVRRE